MQPKKLTVGDIAERTGTAARNLARKIRYNLDSPKMSDRWAAAGIPDPAVIKCGKNDPFITAFADVITSIKIPESATTTGGVYYDAIEQAGVVVRDEDKTPTPTAKVVIQPAASTERRTVPARPMSTPRPNKPTPPPPPPSIDGPKVSDKKPNVSARPLSDRMSPDAAFWLILFVVLIADGISAGLIYFVGLSEFPYAIRYAGSVGFSVVGIAVGYSAVLNYLNLSDKETANLYAFAFAGWQMALHTAAVFSYIQFGQVVVYAGIALATIATTAAIKTR